jgi:hypothetical protein
MASGNIENSRGLRCDNRDTRPVRLPTGHGKWSRMAIDPQLAPRSGRNHRVWWAAYLLLVLSLVASAWALTFTA